MTENNNTVPIQAKACLTIKEAAEYFNIGTAKLYELTSSENCDYVLWVGNRRLIKRTAFEKYLEKSYSI